MKAESSLGPPSGEPDRRVSDVDAAVASGATYWARPPVSSLTVLLLALLFFPIMFVLFGLISGTWLESVIAAVVAAGLLVALWYDGLFRRRRGFYLNQQELGFVGVRGRPVLRFPREDIGIVDVNVGGGYARIIDRSGQQVLDRKLDVATLTKIELMARVIERSSGRTLLDSSTSSAAAERKRREDIDDSSWDGSRWWWNGSKWVKASQAPIPLRRQPDGRRWSSDGQEWWNGSHWVPAKQAPIPIPPPPRSFLDGFLSGGCSSASVVVLMALSAGAVGLWHITRGA